MKCRSKDRSELYGRESREEMAKQEWLDFGDSWYRLCAFDWIRSRCGIENGGDGRVTRRYGIDNYKGNSKLKHGPL